MPSIPTSPRGEVEIVSAELRILNTATTPPFPLEDDVAVDEVLRLRHRVHDLRRPIMQQRLAIRHRLLQSVRATLLVAGIIRDRDPYAGALHARRGARFFGAQSGVSGPAFTPCRSRRRS